MNAKKIPKSAPLSRTQCAKIKLEVMSASVYDGVLKLTIKKLDALVTTFPY